MVGCKNQLIMKYQRKFLVSNICHIDFIIYITKLTIVSIWLRFPIKKYRQQLAQIRFQLNFGKA